jgi:hypothetical protein
MTDALRQVDVWPRKFIKLTWIAVNVAIFLTVGLTFGAVPIYLAYQGTWSPVVVMPFYLFGILGIGLVVLTVMRFIPGLIFTLRSSGPSFILSANGLAFCHLPGRPTLSWEAIESADTVGGEVRVIAISIRSNSDFHRTFSPAAKVFLGLTAPTWQWHGWLFSRLLFRRTRPAQPEYREINLSDLLRSHDAELGYAITVCWFDIDRPLAAFTDLLHAFISAYGASPE